jgi:hypothetical protein
MSPRNPLPGPPATWFVAEYGLWRWRFCDGNVVMGEGVAATEADAVRRLETAMELYSIDKRRRELLRHKPPGQTFRDS